MITLNKTEGEASLLASIGAVALVALVGWVLVLKARK